MANLPNFMRTFSALCAASALVGCQTVAGMLGYVPVELVDGGVPASVTPSGVGIEEATTISGGISLLTAIGMNLWRNHTRAKAIVESGRFVGNGAGGNTNKEATAA